MAFDTAARNRLAKLVGEVRALLTSEFIEQCESLFGIEASGALTDVSQLGHLDEAQRATAILLRERVEYLVRTHTETKDAARSAVTQLVREQAFTVLNRFAALRMAEKRDLIAESVGRGYQSKGFKVFETVARTGLGRAYERYRQYLLCLFDEFALDLGVLFDRRSPQGMLFPRETALLKCFDVLNAADVDALWAEDETIGWVYQYYNDPDERKKMREASSAPRNSRELAVRNQFFTPRFVVEFLTDNTLGRIWYESTEGTTRLKDQCRHLVRHPKDIFVRPGEIAPAQASRRNVESNVVLKQTDLIPSRAIKDPRNILLLDPACGSMHFGLYAFDLFETIYEEGWELEERLGPHALDRAPGMAPLHDTYASREAFLKDVPRLIVQHNLHGIDIDARCSQIAGLSLWLRAQKAWQRLGLAPASRPIIKHSNIVSAEPMPGDKSLLREFVEREFPSGEQKVLFLLLEGIFDHMKSAGEAGSLLKVEEEIRSAISSAKQSWEEKPQLRDAKLFPELETATQGVQAVDLRTITDEQFWDTAESRIYSALRAYAEHAEHGDGLHPRLFAEDAARGFAFIDVCRKRYDVVVTNPPFGSPPEQLADDLGRYDLNGRTDLAAAFVLRGLAQCDGKLGVIVTRSLFMMPGAADWRQQIASLNRFPSLIADYGGGVLDAFVETSAAVFGEFTPDRSLFVDLQHADDKAQSQEEVLSSVAAGSLTPNAYLRSSNDFKSIPLTPVCYWAPDELITLFRSWLPFEPSAGAARTGLATLDNFRFLRCWWETDSTGLYGSAERWRPLAKGGDTWPFFGDIDQRVLWDSNGAELKCFVAAKVGSVSRKIQATEYYGRPGITWIQRSQLGFCPRPLPALCVFDTKGPSAFTDEPALLSTLGIFGSSLYQEILNLQVSAFSYHPGVVQRSPFPVIERSLQERLTESTLRACQIATRLRLDESMVHFVTPLILQSGTANSLEESVKQVELKYQQALDELVESADSLEVSAHEAYGLAVSPLLGARRSRTAKRMRLATRRAGAADVKELISWAIGCAFGRWDIRYGTGEKLVPNLSAPLASLPTCPPGQLQNDQNQPLTRELSTTVHSGCWSFQDDIAWEGILTEDPSHRLDLETRVHRVLQAIWHDRWESTQREACEVLRVNRLREYFYKPTGFFSDHLQKYSKSRRQAPIYWPLSTQSGSYTLWLYYHRLTDQTLHTALADFVDPKVRATEQALVYARSTSQQDEVERLIDVLSELRELRAELDRVIRLPWRPNLNDGVVITASPLWRLFRLPKWQKDLKACWQEVQVGHYDWAHLALSIWPDRVKAACRRDRSLAIAHGMEHLFQEPVAGKKPRRRPSAPEADIDEDS